MGVEYWSGNTEYCDGQPFVGSPADFAYDLTSSSKPFSFGVTCASLSMEMDKDGYITDGDPLVCFELTPNTQPGMFDVGYVKGMARHHTFLLPCLAAYLQNCQIADVLPKSLATATHVHFKLEKPVSYTHLPLPTKRIV